MSQISRPVRHSGEYWKQIACRQQIKKWAYVIKNIPITKRKCCIEKTEVLWMHFSCEQLTWLKRYYRFYLMNATWYSINSHLTITLTACSEYWTGDQHPPLKSLTQEKQVSHSHTATRPSTSRQPELGWVHRPREGSTFSTAGHRWSQWGENFWQTCGMSHYWIKWDLFKVLIVRKGTKTSTDVPNGRELRVLCNCLQH